MQIAEKLADFLQVEFGVEKRERIQEFVVEESKKRALYWQEENRQSPTGQIPEIAYPSHHLIQPIKYDISLPQRLKKWVGKTFKK